jgi:hypothetical protein
VLLIVATPRMSGLREPRLNSSSVVSLRRPKPEYKDEENSYGNRKLDAAVPNVGSQHHLEEAEPMEEMKECSEKIIKGKEKTSKERLYGGKEVSDSRICCTSVS